VPGRDERQCSKKFTPRGSLGALLCPVWPFLRNGLTYEYSVAQTEGEDKLLTRDEARRIAANMAKLTNLLKTLSGRTSARDES